ncbi:S-layer homology domain-containing protein [Pelosinus fermentans]|uniref:S-layer domain-containing protein n=1 Tax=Pelosinus fermentans JBW45 TaxID=1192197 RepID=I9NNW3_9FIRM|nr:S-layer homology domain-containing protein [Pelosinus fermentans]AJQ25977.1 S-layer domain-containing protein [Pelosinus fermentans JBW45]
MNKKLLKVAVTTALAASMAVPAFANPFSDVPAKHWSYDAVNKLAQAGVVEGYGDGTFRGDKTVTRYEMAQIVANAMTKSLNADQKATVDQLSKEFATELNTLGVKVEGMQDQIDKMVKISGDARVRYTNVEDEGDKTDLRTRVSFDGNINEDVKYNARLSGTFQPNENNQTVGIKLDTANVSFNALGADATVGRQDVLLGSGIMFDDKLTGLGLQAGGLKLYAGNNTGTNDADSERMYAAEYGVNIFGAKITADYLKNGDNKAYGINGSAPITSGVTALADYVKNDSNDADATAFGVKLNKLGLTVLHRDADAGVYNAYSSADVIALPTDQAIKGMEYQFDKSLTKNADLKVKYQDFDNMNARTSAAVNVKF